MALTFTTYHYDELSKELLYQMLSLRSEVFVVEQSCHYQDLDFYDLKAHHIGVFDGKALVGVARILPPGIKREYPSIGRYALKESARGTGMGRQLFAYAIQACQEMYAGHTIYIQAQHQLERFYQSFGFVTIGTPYDEAGLPHVDMLLAPDAKTAQPAT